MTEKTPEPDKEEVRITKKLPYVPPKLTELGSFDEITRSTGKKGSKDNAGRGATYDKTSF